MMIEDLLGGFRFPAGAPSDRAVRKSLVAGNDPETSLSRRAPVTKSVDAAIRPVDSKHPNGEFVLILSKDNLDRDAENLWADEWMHPLPVKIHMDTDHAFAKGLSVPYTAGSGVPSITENGDLLVKGTYAGTTHGQLTRQLVNEGHIWQASVSYQTHMSDDGRVVRELLNGTFTGVPSNPEAVVLSSKAKGDDSGYGENDDGDDGSWEVGDDFLVQAIHDAAIALGAECRPLRQATVANSKSKKAPLKGKDVRNSSESNGYSIQITGPSGRERYSLRYRGRIVGCDLRQAIAKGSARERVKRFERKNSALMRAEARLRKFTFDSRLTEKA